MRQNNNRDMEAHENSNVKTHATTPNLPSEGCKMQDISSHLHQARDCQRAYNSLLLHSGLSVAPQLRHRRAASGTAIGSGQSSLPSTADRFEAAADLNAALASFFPRTGEAMGGSAMRMRRTRTGGGRRNSTRSSAGARRKVAIFRRKI